MLHLSLCMHYNKKKLLKQNQKMTTRYKTIPTCNIDSYEEHMKRIRTGRLVKDRNVQRRKSIRSLIYSLAAPLDSFINQS